MSDLRERLKREFKDEDCRYAYAESFLNTKLAAQIRVLREKRKKTQVEMGAAIGTKQSGYSRFEDVNHSVWKTDTLWKIARALGVRLNISFETFGSLIDEKERFNREILERPDYAEDPDARESGLLLEDVYKESRLTRESGIQLRSLAGEHPLSKIALKTPKQSSGAAIRHIGTPEGTPIGADPLRKPPSGISSLASIHSVAGRR